MNQIGLFHGKPPPPAALGLKMPATDRKRSQDSHSRLAITRQEFADYGHCRRGGCNAISLEAYSGVGFQGGVLRFCLRHTGAAMKMASERSVKQTIQRVRGGKGGC